MMPTPQWFARRVDSAGECWKWLGGHTPAGYGTCAWKEDGKTKGTPAHRLAYRLFVGEPKSGKQIHHTCGNRGCVRPSHLTELTRNEHALAHSLMNDAWLRQRWEMLDAVRAVEERYS